jgi:hypothetical protein
MVEATNRVMLELSRRATAESPSNVNTIATNRISLLCESITISTDKSAFPIDIPFSGVIAGESSTVVMDMGAARKQITLNGIIYEQEIVKFKGGQDETPKTIKLTSYEIAQLIHSYVDSSFIHEDQNISKLIMLIPSRADNNFDYRSSTSDPPTANSVINADTPLEDLPLIPFHFANRTYDVKSFSYGQTKGTFDYLQNTNDEIEGVRGFINQFSTDIAGAESPHISFNMTFIQSSTVVSDFINTTF